MIEHAIVQVKATFVDEYEFDDIVCKYKECEVFEAVDLDELFYENKKALICCFKSIGDFCIADDSYGSCVEHNANQSFWIELLDNWQTEIHDFASKQLSTDYIKDKNNCLYTPGVCLFFLLIKSYMDDETFEIKELKIITAEDLVGRLFHA